jgi:hypothetical protein
MNGAVLIRWGASIPGREPPSLEVFGKTVAYFENLSKAGRIHGHREYFAVTGPDGGFMMLDGELDELMKILAEPGTRKLTAQAGAIVTDIEIQAYAGGSDQAIQELTGEYEASMKDLGYM